MGYRNHLSCVSVDSYLPTSRLQGILLEDFDVCHSLSYHNE